MTVRPAGGPALAAPKAAPAPAPLAVSTATDGPRVVVRVAGELLQETAPEFADAVDDLVVDPALTDLVVDLTGTSFMDSTGLGSLVALRNRLLQRGVTLRVVRPAERVFRLFVLTRLDTLFEFVERDQVARPVDLAAPAGPAQAAGASR